jgi:hypothetical protein
MVAPKDPEKYRQYMKVYMLARYHRRKAEVFKALGGKCTKCGSVAGLQLDHIGRSTKSFTIGKTLVSVSEAKLQEELKKCQLLCLECHQLKSCEERGFKMAKGHHGTISSYRYCHCELCKEAKRKQWRKNKLAKHSAPID